MPSQKWLESRRQVKFYLDAETYEALKRECARRGGISVSTVLRQAVQAYIRNGSASPVEARQVARRVRTHTQDG